MIGSAGAAHASQQQEERRAERAWVVDPPSLSADAANSNANIAAAAAAVCFSPALYWQSASTNQTIA